jgi:hypothetical protein
MLPTPTTSPARCPVTPETAERLAAAGLSALTEGDALLALARLTPDKRPEGAPDCYGQFGTTRWCDDCNLSAECRQGAGAPPKRRPPPPGGGR